MECRKNSNVDKQNRKVEIQNRLVTDIQFILIFSYKNRLFQNRLIDP